MFDNFDSRYLTIKHKVSSGESLNVILEKYEIPKLEIKKIKKELSKKKNLNNLIRIIFSYVSLKVDLKSINSSKFNNYIWENI